MKGFWILIYLFVMMLFVAFIALLADEAMHRTYNITAAVLGLTAIGSLLVGLFGAWAAIEKDV